MKCQLGRILEDERVSADYWGLYVWVEVGAPVMRAARHYETHIPVAPCLQYRSPYRGHGGLLVIPAEPIELLPVSADVPERSFEEWLSAGGEPPPDIA